MTLEQATEPYVDWVNHDHRNLSNWKTVVKRLAYDHLSPEDLLYFTKEQPGSSWHGHTRIFAVLGNLKRPLFCKVYQDKGRDHAEQQLLSDVEYYLFRRGPPRPGRKLKLRVFANHSPCHMDSHRCDILLARFFLHFRQALSIQYRYRYPFDSDRVTEEGDFDILQDGPVRLRTMTDNDLEILARYSQYLAAKSARRAAATADVATPSVAM